MSKTQNGSEQGMMRKQQDKWSKIMTEWYPRDKKTLELSVGKMISSKQPVQRGA